MRLERRGGPSDRNILHEDILSRLRIDARTLAIVAIVVIAAILPARGAGKDVLDMVVHAAIALLFFIYGARIFRQAIWSGIMNRRIVGRSIRAFQWRLYAEAVMPWSDGARAVGQNDIRAAICRDSQLKRRGV